MTRTEDLLGCRYPAVSVFRCAEPPDRCGLVVGGHCCIQTMLRPACEGRSVCGDRPTLHCRGSWSGLGLGEEDDFGMIADAYSTGTDDRPGNRYFDCPERVRTAFIDHVPARGSASDHVVMEPLETTLANGTTPETVVLLVDPLRLSALMTALGFDLDYPPLETRFAYSCQQLFLLPLLEGGKKEPHAVLGLTELYTRRFVDPDLMSVSMPWSMFERLERNADRTFLAGDGWRRIVSENGKPPGSPPA